MDEIEIPQDPTIVEVQAIEVHARKTRSDRVTKTQLHLALNDRQDTQLLHLIRNLRRLIILHLRKAQVNTLISLLLMGVKMYFSTIIT
jgi:hypothetical protein